MSQRFVVLIAGLVLALSTAVHVQQSSAPAASDSTHVMLTPDAIQWGPAPPALPPGAQAAVLAGDPSKAGEPFTIRAKFPDGYKVPPHWHPTDEHVAVLQGTLLIGMGERFDVAAARELPVGGFAKMPKGVRHYAQARGETVIQVHGTGPFELTYVNAADDPRGKKPTN